MLNRFVLILLLLVPTWTVAGAQDSPETSAFGEKAKGYVVVLKNGEKMRCRAPLEVKGSLGILTLVTGQVTSYPLSYIDLVETERYNQLGLGDAILIEELSVKGEDVKPTPTPEPTLGNLATISAGNTDAAALKTTTEPTPVPTPKITMQSEPYHDSRVDSAFATIFDARKVYLYRTSEGTEPEYFFIRIVTSSQREVFHSLRVVAEAYDTILRLQPEVAPEAIELEMVEASGRAAGTFRFRPADIRPLIDEEVPIEQFYVTNVVF